MATEMIMSLSPKEYVLVGLTATLVPISLVELAAVTKMRGFLPQVEDDPAMPHASDLLAGVACALVITVLRRYFADALQPVGRLVLAPKKQTKDRLLRFGTVLFKFMYVLRNCRTVVGRSADEMVAVGTLSSRRRWATTC